MKPLQIYHQRALSGVRAIALVIGVAALGVVFGDYSLGIIARSDQDRIEGYHLASLNHIRDLNDQLGQAFDVYTNDESIGKDAVFRALIYAMDNSIRGLARLQEQYSDPVFSGSVARLQTHYSHLRQVYGAATPKPDSMASELRSIETSMLQLEKLHLIVTEERVLAQATRREQRSIFVLLMSVTLGLTCFFLVIRIFKNLRAARDDQLERDKELDDARRRLHVSEKLNALGLLVGGVAHDFNNLLTVIIGRSLSLLNRTSDSAQKKGLGEIQRAGEQAARLTQQLLVFSSQAPEDPQTVDTAHRLEQMKPILRQMVTANHTLRVEASDNTPFIDIDPGKLEQIIFNLVSNAVEAVGDRGDISVATGQAALATEQAVQLGVAPGTYCCITVADNGVGMNRDLQKRIFDPFFSTNSRGKGTGLGLSTVHGIVAACRGGIDLQSAPGEGSRFQVYLPASGKQSEGTLTRPEESARGGDETILLIEDEDQIREMMLQELRDLGYTVLAAADGDQAIEIAAQQTGRINLILSDVILPGLNGPDAVEQIMQDQTGAAVIYVSGYTDDVVLKTGIPESGVTFVRKPFRPNDIAGLIRRMLDNQQISAA
ncbi:MAG: ATP-binding protein [Xanthomonadales bacterium]|nr:ATP-binding protein [Xanthomonadales bacterium]